MRTCLRWIGETMSKNKINRVKLCTCFVIVGLWGVLSIAGMQIVLTNCPDTPSYELYPVSFILFPAVVCVVIYGWLVLIVASIGWVKRWWEWLHED